MIIIKVNKLKAGAILSYIVILCNMIVGLLYTPFLIRQLGQSDYGLYSIVSSVIAYLTVLDLGFGNAIIVYTSRYLQRNNKEDESRLYGMFVIIYIIIGIIAALIGIALYFNVGLIFGNAMTPEEIFKARIMMIILTVNLAITFPLSIFGNILVAYEEFIINKLIKILNIILQPILMIPLLLMGYKSIAMVVILSVINVICLLTNAIACFKKLKIKMIFGKFNFKLLREIFGYSVFVFLAEITNKINWNVDQFVLGAFKGTIAVAVYSVASQINAMYLAFSTAISGVMLPKITKMEERKASNKEFTDIFIRTGRIQYIVMFLIITGFIIFGQRFINIWAGQEYSTAYLIGCILMIPVTIPLIQNVGISILQAKNKYKYRTMILIGVAIVNVIISIPLAINYSGVGSAIGTALALILGQGILLNIYYHKKVHINIIEFWKNILKMTIPMMLCFGACFGLFRLIKSTSIIVYVSEVAVYSILYAIIVWVFVTNEYEKQIVYKALKKLHIKEK